jgi:hypothetical protein
LREAQTTAGSLHLPGAFARRTSGYRTARVARAVTARTLVRSIDRKIRRKAGDGFFKTERERHLDVGATLRLWPGWLAFRFRATEKIRKDVAEAAA